MFQYRNNIPKEKIYKFVCIGDSGVGKSCLLIRFTENKFIDTHDLTIGVEFGAKNINIKDEKIKLIVWDTAGQESFRGITRAYYRNCPAAIVVFDITRRETFEHLNEWLDELHKNNTSKFKMIIVGNKSDLVEKRAVTTEEALEFARVNGCSYFETSAKTGENVEKIFVTLAEQVYESGYYEEHLRNTGLRLSQPPYNVQAPAKKCCN